MSNFKLILNIAWAVIRWLFRKGETKDNEVQAVKKEMNEAFKVKDKKERASRINTLVHHINGM